MSDVEYEWAVIHECDGRPMRLFATDGDARIYVQTWRNLTDDKVHVARRPVVQWERVS